MCFAPETGLEEINCDFLEADFAYLSCRYRKLKSTFSPQTQKRYGDNHVRARLVESAKEAIVPWRFGKQDDRVCPAQTVQRSRL